MGSDNIFSPGCLYLVATPIGNLDDISHRALQTLENVDLIACEDTRHSKKLLNYYGITTKLISYFREKEQQRASLLLTKLAEGINIALITDAGTPGISDPGSVIVRLARKHGFQVVTIPGPSALTAALSIAGLEGSSFYFGGFPPAKQGQRKNYFSSLVTVECPLVFYESPHRIKTCLSDCLDILGNRDAIIFRELTKLHEECRTGPLEELATMLPDKNKGEFVLIVKPALKTTTNAENIEHELQWYKDRGFTLKDSVSSIASDLGLPRKKVYSKALDFWKRDNNRK